MRLFAVVPLAAILAFGLGSAAHAIPTASETALGEAAFGLEYDHADQAGVPYHRCHGRASGTAHASCGTMTGGPSGGLF